MDSKNFTKKIAELSGLQKLGIYCLTLLLIAGGYWYFVFDDALAQVAKLKQEISQTEGEISRFRALVAKLPEIERSREIATQELYYAKTLLPEDARALEELLSSFEKIGRDENVDFVLFQPGAETQYDFYATRTVQLQIRGAYHRLMSYFDRLSRLDRLVSIQSVTFSPVLGNNPLDVYLNTTLMLQVYRSLTDAEIKAREEAKLKQKKK